MGALGTCLFYNNFSAHLPSIHGILFNEGAPGPGLFHKSFKILDELLAFFGWMPG